jgi:hypothetical protein
MCLICVEFQKQRMTSAEARRALGEMAGGLGPEHTREVQRLLREAEEQAQAASPAAAPTTAAPTGLPTSS